MPIPATVLGLLWLLPRERGSRLRRHVLLLQLGKPGNIPRASLLLGGCRRLGESQHEHDLHDETRKQHDETQNDHPNHLLA
jgi:hypothetical protein